MGAFKCGKNGRKQTVPNRHTRCHRGPTKQTPWGFSPEPATSAIHGSLGMKKTAPGENSALLPTTLFLLCNKAKAALTVPLCSDVNSSTHLFLPGYQGSSMEQAHSGHQCTKTPSSSTVNQACLPRSLLCAENG